MRGSFRELVLRGVLRKTFCEREEREKHESDSRDSRERSCSTYWASECSPQRPLSVLVFKRPVVLMVVGKDWQAMNHPKYECRKKCSHPCFQKVLIQEGEHFFPPLLPILKQKVA